MHSWSRVAAVPTSHGSIPPMRPASSPYGVAPQGTPQSAPSRGSVSLPDLQREPEGTTFPSRYKPSCRATSSSPAPPHRRAGRTPSAGPGPVPPDLQPGHGPFFPDHHQYSQAPRECAASGPRHRLLPCAARPSLSHQAEVPERPDVRPQAPVPLAAPDTCGTRRETAARDLTFAEPRASTGCRAARAESRRLLTRDIS